MNIVVTGATGHIGNVLVRELLAQGHSVRALVPPFENDLPIRGLDVEIVAADVCDAASLSTAFEGADAVYHLAGIIAITPGREALLQRVNVEGTRNVVAACLKSCVGRLVYTSSIHAIQEPPEGIVINETFPVDPDNVLGPYARSKAMATLEVKKGIAHGLNAVIVHPTGVIGPFDFRISEMGQLMLDFIRGKLKAYLDGAYDFADVRDVAHGMTLACSKGRRGESYILSGERVSIKRIMELLEEISGVKAPKFKVPAWLAHSVGKLAPIYYRIARSKPLFTDYSVDVLRSNSVVTSEKARMELGYKPRTVQESICDSVAWFRQHLTPAQLAAAVRRI
ncbi:MAG: SDR family oxidoreductase [Dehalococcoidia bacterium]|nr:SDR family oxidoreductase [Dehalococcoidia bacterium]